LEAAAICGDKEFGRAAGDAVLTCRLQDRHVRVGEEWRQTAKVISATVDLPISASGG
jgi:hypothetical protein